MAATQHQLRLRNGELIIFSPGEHAHLGPYISARVDTDGILQLQLNFHARRTELKEHGKLMVHFSVGRPKENFFLDVEDLADVSTFVPPRKKTICRGINVDTEARRLWARLSSVANLQREPAVCFRVLAQFVRSRSVNTSAVRHVERLEEASYSDRQGEQDSSVTSSSDIVVDDKESSNDNLPVIRRKIKQGSMKRLRRLERETRHHARLRMPPVLTAPRPYLPSPLQTPPHQHKQTREEQFAALVSQSQRETRDLLAAQRNSADSLRRTNLTPSPPNLTPVQTPEARPALSSPTAKYDLPFQLLCLRLASQCRMELLVQMLAIEIQFAWADKPLDMRSLKSMLPYLNSSLHEFWIQWTFCDYDETRINGDKWRVLLEMWEDPSDDGKAFRDFFRRNRKWMEDKIDREKMGKTSPGIIGEMRTSRGIEVSGDRHGEEVNGERTAAVDTGMTDASGGNFMVADITNGFSEDSLMIGGIG